MNDIKLVAIGGKGMTKELKEKLFNAGRNSKPTFSTLNVTPNGRIKDKPVLIICDEISPFNKTDFEKIKKALEKCPDIIERKPGSVTIANSIDHGIPTELVKEIEKKFKDKMLYDLPERHQKPKKKHQKFGAMGRHKNKQYF